eukprot:15579394-Heterocapsa_arctica.AAC.1
MAPSFERWVNQMLKRLRIKAKAPPPRWQRFRKFCPVVGVVPVVPPSVSDSARWKEVLRGAWAYSEAIHVLEAR